MLEVFVRAGDEKVAALQLRLAQIDAAVGVGRGAEFEAQLKILGKLASGPERLNATAFGGRRDDETSVDGAVASVRALSLSVERLVSLHFHEQWGAGLGRTFAGRRGAVAPSGQVLAVEEAHEAGLRLEVAGRCVEVAERGEHRTQRRGPLRVAGGVEVEQVGEESRNRIAFGIREEGIGVEYRELRVALHRGGEEFVDGEDGLLRALLRGGAREDAADDDWHLRVVGLEGRDDLLEIAPDGVDRHFDLDVVRAHQQHDRFRAERQHVLLQSDEHAAGGVSADAAVGELHSVEGFLEVRTPALGDRIPEEDHRALVLGDVGGPLRADGIPALHIAVVAAKSAFAGQLGLGLRCRECVVGRIGGQGGEREDEEGEQAHGKGWAYLAFLAALALGAPALG